METNIIKADQSSQEIIQKLVLDGDLSKMQPQQKVEYYNKFCQALGLNPLTQPFQLLEFQGKQRLYATKDCTEQLRKIHGVSITDVTATELKNVYVVTAKAIDKNGKTDAATGVVPLTRPETKWDEQKRRSMPTGRVFDLSGDDLANALMKAETKAKRRVTLSICGLGLLDESELDTMKGAETKPVQTEDIQHTVVNTQNASVPQAPATQMTSNPKQVLVTVADVEDLDSWKQALAEIKTIDELNTFYTGNLEAINTYDDIKKLVDAKEIAIRSDSTRNQKPWLNQDSKMYEKVVGRLKERTTTMDEVAQHFQMSRTVRAALQTVINSVAYSDTN